MAQCLKVEIEMGGDDGPTWVILAMLLLEEQMNENRHSTGA